MTSLLVCLPRPERANEADFAPISPKRKKMSSTTNLKDKREDPESLLSAHDKNYNPLSKKIHKILDTRLENDKDTLDALKELSSFFKENTLQARRNLRGQIERRSVGINEEFVDALRDVKVAIDNIYKEVNDMNKDCSDMKKRLQVTKSETRHLIQQTNSLQTQSQKLQMQEDVVKTFLNVFQLTPDETVSLKGASRDAPITPPFFDSLSKTLTIRNNTKYLFQTGHQKTALDIMEQMNVTREAALERLFRWFQSQTRSPDPSPLLPQALAALQERPVLFKMVIEEWIVVRRGWLTRGFLDALTLGGPFGAPRPIELRAHDPLRYVGDMLAWVHQALPSEREAAQLLFSQCSDIDRTEQTQLTVSGVSESVCRPLKSRIEQVIVSEQVKGDTLGGKKSVQLYKISSLLHFYMSTVKQVTGKGLLVSTLEDLFQLSYKMFLAALQSQVTHACERVEPPGETLAPSAGVAKTLSVLTEIVTAATVSDDSHQDFKQIIDCVVDPLLSAIRESGSSLAPVEGAVYLLNCLHQLHSTLSLLHTSSDKLKLIQGQMEAELETLSQEQVNGVFHALGLSSIYHVISPSPPVPPLSAHPSCQPLTIQAFVTKLDGFLAAPDYLMLPQTRSLLSSAFRKQLQSRSAQAVVSTYSRLYSLVAAPENEYPDPASLLPKSPDVVKSLLL